MITNSTFHVKNRKADRETEQYKQITLYYILYILFFIFILSITHVRLPTDGIILSSAIFLETSWIGDHWT